MTTPAASAHSTVSWPWQASFVAVAATWGCSFWWIKLGLEFLTPLQVAFVRLAVGAVALSIVCLLTGTRLPRGRATWRRLALLGFTWNAAPFSLFALGETHVSSVLAGLINGAMPLATLAVILLAYHEERPTADKIAGLLIGFAGLLVVVGVWQGLGSGEWLGVGACLLAIVCYGISVPYARRHLMGLPDGGLSLVTGQIVCGALLMAPLGIAGGLPHLPSTPAPILAMLGLGALGSGLAFVMNFQVIREIGSTAASTVTYLIPLFAVLVGVAFLGETVSWNEPLGGLVVLLGVAFGQGQARALAGRIGRVFRRSAELAPD